MIHTVKIKQYRERLIEFTDYISNHTVIQYKERYYYITDIDIINSSYINVELTEVQPVQID